MDAWLIACEERAIDERVRRIRAAHGRVPLMVISSGAETAALDAGADSFCRWPEDAAVLASRIHALLRRASGTFRVADSNAVQLLEHDQALRLGDQRVSLSLLEYRLLRRLDERRNRWVSTEELWHLLTASSVRAYDSSQLRMHLLRIRKKLGTWCWILRTERNRGIMLTDEAT